MFWKRTSLWRRLQNAFLAPAVGGHVGEIGHRYYLFVGMLLYSMMGEWCITGSSDLGSAAHNRGVGLVEMDVACQNLTNRA